MLLVLMLVPAAGGMVTPGGCAARGGGGRCRRWGVLADAALEAVLLLLPAPPLLPSWKFPRAGVPVPASILPEHS